MEYDKRKTRRSQVNQYGRILCSNGSMPCFCTMLDVSATGAKLRLNDCVELPELFTLLLSRDGRVRRHCKLEWQRGDHVGVAFTIPEAPITK